MPLALSGAGELGQGDSGERQQPDHDSPEEMSDPSRTMDPRHASLPDERATMNVLSTFSRCDGRGGWPSCPIRSRKSGEVVEEI